MVLLLRSGRGPRRIDRSSSVMVGRSGL